MSNALFPTLPGRSWNRMRTPIFKTMIQESINGKEVRWSNQAYPRWKYTLSYEVLRHAPAYQELQTLIGFFCARRGSWDSFLYLDPNDQYVQNHALATMNVNGISTYEYQLIRSYGGFTEPVQAPDAGTVEIKADGAGSWTLPNGKISVSATTGVVTFAPGTAPGTGQVLTWTGGYYWRCRFLQDSAEFNEFLKLLWEAKKIEFITDKQ
jgi:uncharacterized protein (TIGR02217 family)